MRSSIFDKIMQEADSEFSTKVSEGNEADISSYTDTGSYSLNAIISGSIYGGLPDNKIIGLAGDPSTGKTFYSLSIVKHFLDHNPEGETFYFESESAITTQMLEERGIDTQRFRLMPVATIQEFRTQVLKVVNAYLEIDKKKRPPMFLVLDSLGGLSTIKEIKDMTEGSETKDMGRPALIKAAFRVLTLKLARAKVPMIVTNHVYASMNPYGEAKTMGGGTGLQYAASQVLMLSKSKRTDTSTKEVTGAIINVKTHKSRWTIENKKIETLLDYQTGLNRYYGILDVAEAHDLVKRVGNKYSFPNGEVAFENAVYKNPEKYFTKELLDAIDEVTKKEYRYGTANAMDTE